MKTSFEALVLECDSEGVGAGAVLQKKRTGR